MSGKFMAVKRYLIPTLTMVIIASQLMGCAATNDSELLQMLNNGTQIEIEIATPISEEQGTEQSIDWIQLDQLTTYADFRAQLDDIMKITTYGQGSKNGICYIDLEGNQEGNNTLYNAMMNRKFIANFYENDTANLEVQQRINSVYVDTDESNAMVAAINAYWNLLPDAEPNYFNPGQTLTRLEAMSLLARANHQVTDEIGNEAFTSAVGQSDFTDIASLVADDSYLTVANKSLNEKTANGKISRGEYIYLLISNIFGQDRMSSADIKKAQFNDCKNAGDIASQQKVEDTSADYYGSYELKFMLDNPDNGCSEKMYQALVTAQELGILGSDTRWDEALTKSEAISLYLDTLQAYTKENGYPVDSTGGAGTNDGTIVEIQKPGEESQVPIIDEETGMGMDEDDMLANMADEENSAENSEDFEIIPMDEQVGYIISNKANVRSGPSTDYDIVDSMKYGDSAVFNGYVEQGDSVWYVIKDDNQIKMVSKTLVSSEKPQPQQSSGNTGGSTGGSTGGTTQQPSGNQPSGGESSGGGDEPSGNVDNSYLDSILGTGPSMDDVPTGTGSGAGAGGNDINWQ